MLRRLLHPEGESPKSSAALDAGTPRKRLGEMLIEGGILTQEQLEAGLQRQQSTGQFLGQALVELGYITQETLVNLLVKQCRVPHVNLLEYHVSKELLQAIPPEVCLKHGVLPIDQLGRILTVAMVDPLDVEALEAVRQACPDLRIKPILCEWSHFEQVAERLLNKAPEVAAECSMASLGLSAQAASTDSPKGEPAMPPASARTAAPPRAGAPSPAAEGQGRDLAQVVAATVREAMLEAAGAVAAQVRAAAPGQADGPTAEALSAAMRSAMREAFREAAAEMRAHAEPAVDARSLIEGIRDSLRETMREALTTISQSASRGPATPVGPGSQEIAEVVQAGFREALRESLGELTHTLLPAVQATGSPAGQAPDARSAQLSDAAIETLQAAQAAIRAQEAQAAHMLSIVEAVRESAEQASREAHRAANHAEAASVHEQSRRAVMRGGSAQGKRRQVAALLGKTEQDALEAIEGPGVELRIDERILAALESEAPLPGYTFDGFVVGNANAFTAKVAMAAASTPGGDYNPLFIYGNVGLGKTHLINAIGNAVLARSPESNVGCVSASRFARKLSDALEEHALDDFREAYCQWDVLLLDDVQFLGGRIEAQEEFFHVFNALHQESRQIVIAGDRPPDRLGELEQRLVSRFGSGIVAGLQPPDWETRMTILRRYAAAAGAGAPEDMLALIATKVTSDVRRLTGSLRKIMAYADLMGQEVSVSLAAETLGHLGLDPSP